MKHFFYLLIVLFFVPSLWSQDIISPARWQEKKVLVDGLHEEWEVPFRFYNRSGGLTYSISNDATHLYLCFVSVSPLKIVKMLHAGWSLRISSRERKKKLNATIEFSSMHIDLEPKHDYIEQKGKTGPTFKNWLDDYRLENCRYEVSGFKISKDASFEMKEQKNAIPIVLNYNEEEAVYEIAIPLDELFPEKSRTLEEILKLKININALESPPDEDSKLSVGPTQRIKPIISGSRGSFNDPIVRQDKEPKEKKGEHGLYRKAYFVTDFQLTKPVKKKK